MTRLVGLDISSYQGTITWSSVAKTKQFVIIRASTGLGADSKFSTNITGAIAAGMYAGSYHFAYYNDAGHTPAYEANIYWNQIKGYLAADGKHLLPMLDIEEGTTLGSGTGATSLSDWINQWCAIISSDYASVGYAGVTPMIYASESHAGSYFSSSIPQSYPLINAVWPGDGTGSSVNTDTGAPANSGLWATWQAWQYADKGTVSGISTNVDLDVMNGNQYSIYDLVLGGAGRWADNSLVTTTAAVTATTSATGSTGTAVASGVVGKVLSGPTYWSSYWRWDVQFSNGVTGWVSESSLQTTIPNTTSNPAPVSATTWVSSLPVNFTWTGTNAASDSVYLDGIPKGTSTTNSWAHTAIADGVHTWRVDATNAELTVTGATWSFSLDTTAPVAKYGSQTPTYGSTTLVFTVAYTDVTSGVAYASLNTGDVIVTGPNGYSQTATFVSVDAAVNGGTRTATYSISAPGGTWGNPDSSGAYTVSLAGSQVKDVAANYMAAGTLGSFSVVQTFAYESGSTLQVAFGAPGPITLTASGSTLTATQGASSYTFNTSGISNIVLAMTSGADALILSGTMPVPLLFEGTTGGSDTITLNSGAAAAIGSDPGGAAVTVNSGAAMTVSVPAVFSAMTITGGAVALAAGGSNTLRVSSLVISGGGSLNTNDNDLIWDYAGATPINTLRGYLLSGRNGGTWDGPGIDSSSAAATGANGIGYAEATDLGVTSIDGQAVDSTTLVLKYTLAGDANLDGRVSSDDYVLADRGMSEGSQAGGSYWIDGDFNYNGSVDPGDYLLLDGTYAHETSGVTLDPQSLAAREAQFGEVYVENLLAASGVTDVGGDAQVQAPAMMVVATPAETSSPAVALQSQSAVVDQTTSAGGVAPMLARTTSVSGTSDDLEKAHEKANKHKGKAGELHVRDGHGKQQNVDPYSS
jgi:GH25 family lysozyme M1 (1,4-beta-N-acetylmuramidase)